MQYGTDQTADHRHKKPLPNAVVGKHNGIVRPRERARPKVNAAFEIIVALIERTHDHEPHRI